MALLSKSSRHRRGGRRRVARRFAFEPLEPRNLLAVLVDVGHHFVEPNASGQTVSLSVVSTNASDKPVAGFDLRAQIITSQQGPKFQGVRFAGDLWNSFPHVESGGPFPADRTLASGDVAFTHKFEARADGTLVTLTIDTTGVPAGSYEFRLVGTKLGSSSFHRADGSRVSEIITNGTLQVRSIWQNPDNPNDIDGDGRISPLDVLLLLNELSKKGSHELSMPSPGEKTSPYFDVNGDGHLSPLDPLGAINCLNGLSCVTTPKPILARVTPGFAPEFPDSTGVGEPIPDDTKPDDVPPEEVDPVDPRAECAYYYIHEDGNPIPITDPICEDFEEGDPNPFLVDPIETERVDATDNSIIEQPLADTEEALLEYPTLPSEFVDLAVLDLTGIFDRANNPSDELIDLGLT